jgi:hypothetical protein
VIAYRAMLDVPRELVRHLAGLLAAGRRVLGTLKKTRALTCSYDALLALAWYRKGEDLTLLAAGFGVSRATAYRYRDEATRVLAVTAPDLHEPCAASLPTAGRTSSSMGRSSPPTAAPKRPPA